MSDLNAYKLVGRPLEGNAIQTTKQSVELYISGSLMNRPVCFGGLVSVATGYPVDKFPGVTSGPRYYGTSEAASATQTLRFIETSEKKKRREAARVALRVRRETH